MRDRVAHLLYVEVHLGHVLLEVGLVGEELSLALAVVLIEIYLQFVVNASYLILDLSLDLLLEHFFHVY
jgi:hypothetical protein